VRMIPYQWILIIPRSIATLGPIGVDYSRTG
jgi:hypothetical protein